jgi:hypothetical protein
MEYWIFTITPILHYPRVAQFMQDRLENGMKLYENISGEGPAKPKPGPVDDNQLFDFDVNLLGNFDIGFGDSYLQHAVFKRGLDLLRLYSFP